MRILIIADVHANRAALTARLQTDTLLRAGDLAGCSPYPMLSTTAQRLGCIAASVRPTVVL